VEIGIPPTAPGGNQMCGTDTRNRPYDCRDCTCPTSSLYTPNGHTATVVKIGGIYYTMCKVCGKDC
jgi:hypothetical protein